MTQSVQPLEGRMTRILTPWDEGKGRVIDAEEALRRVKSRKAPEPPKVKTPKPLSLEDYIMLEDITCTDADGNVFEQYKRLYLAKDVIHYSPLGEKSSTFEAILTAESQGGFVPSLALTCNILAKLLQLKEDPTIDAVLRSYATLKGLGTYTVQNTIIDCGNHEIIHYPMAHELVTAGFPRTVFVNVQQRRKFPYSAFGPGPISGPVWVLHPSFLANGEPKRFFQNLTGLSDPIVLYNISNYLGNGFDIWTPSLFTESGTRSVAISLQTVGFRIHADRDINASDNVARWVRET